MSFDFPFVRLFGNFVITLIVLKNYLYKPRNRKEKITQGSVDRTIKSVWLRQVFGLLMVW